MFTRPRRVVALLPILVALVAIASPAAGDGLGVQAGPVPAIAFQVETGAAFTGDGDPVLLSRLDVLAPESLAVVETGDVVVVDVPGAAPIAVTVDRRRDTAPGRYTLSSRLDGPAPGRFVLAVNGEAVSGVLQRGEDLYRVLPVGGGLHAVEAIDDDALPACDVPGDPPLPLDGDGGGDPGFGACDDGTVVDIVIVYTSAARSSAGGTDGVIAVIDMMVEDANLAYVNSLLDLELNLVYATEVEHAEGGNLLSQLTMPNDGQLDEAHVLREAFSADLVALVHSGGGGVAWGLGSLGDTDGIGFSSNGIQSAAVMVLAHEVGHNLGCCHAVGDGGGCGVGLLFPYSNGHRFNGDSGMLWRTVMAYSPGQRIPNFSNPDVDHDGVPTGVPEQAQLGADNARTINASKAHVANYRCAGTACDGLDLPPDAEDCNDNGVPDECDLVLGWSTDENGNGLLDDCECLHDTNGDGVVDESDCLNDSCAGATDVAAGTIVIVTVQADTDGPLDNACSQDGSAQVYKDLWFRYVPTASEFVTVSLCGSDFDTRLAAYASLCPATVNQAIACDDDSVCDSQASISFPVMASVPYLLRVGGYEGQAGEAALTIETTTALANDNCGNPTMLQDGETFFSTHGATSGGPGEAGACGVGDGVFEHDVWYRYESECDGPVTVSVCAADFDTLLAVYGGCPPDSGQAIACNDDSILCDGLASRLTFDATAGGSYRIRVGGAGQTGTGTIAVTCGLSGCPSDVTGDAVTDMADLQAILDRYGTICVCPEDIVFSGLVDVSDLVAVIEGWGACP